MKPSLVLWDWNGTLLDDVALCVDALNRLLRIYHYPQQYSLAQYREIFGFPIEDYYIRAGFDFSKNSYKELADDYMQDYLARAGACPLAESAVPALSLLKGAGVQQVILSASNLPVLEQQVTERGVRPYFDRLLGLDNIYARSKVEVGLAYLTELKQRGAVPAQAIMGAVLIAVGANLLVDNGTLIAQALGVRCVLQTAGHQSAQQLRATGAPVLPDVLAAAQYCLNEL